MIGEKPIIIRKPRQRMTTVGCLLTKLVSGFDKSSMTPMAMTTAIIATGRCCTMPTAVITLSSEKIASRITTICDHLPEDRMHHLLLGGLDAALEPLVQLHCALEEQERAADEQDDVAAGEAELHDRKAASSACDQAIEA